MKETITGGLITYEFDAEMLKVIEDALGDLKGEARKVLKNAVNATARQAKKDLAKKAKETYATKQASATKAMKTKNATASKPEATIKVTGAKLELKDFKVSPQSLAIGRSRPGGYSAKVLLSSGMKPLSGDPKAFLTKFKSGHVSVVERLGPERLPLKKLLSPSVPQMIGSQERVYGVVEPHIYSNLHANIMKEIGKVLK